MTIPEIYAILPQVQTRLRQHMPFDCVSPATREATRSQEPFSFPQPELWRQDELRASRMEQLQMYSKPGLPGPRVQRATSHFTRRQSRDTIAHRASPRAGDLFPPVPVKKG